MKSLLRSKSGLSTVISSLLMVVIVVAMSVIVGIFYGNVLTSLFTSGKGPHPEFFTIIQSSTLSSGSFDPNTVQPTGSPPSISSSGTAFTSSSPINTPVNGGVYVPPGQSCTITASVSSGVQVNYGASLTVQGASISGGIKDNSSSSISLQGGATVTGGISLYGTGNFYLTGSQVSSGSVVLNGVKYASISSSTGPGLSGGLNALSSGSVQVDSNTITGGTFFTNDKVVRMTNNSGSGGMHFSNDPDCLMQNNSISGGISGTCTGGTSGGGLDIMNTVASTVNLNGAYLNSQPWTGVAWQLISGTTEMCGSTAIPIGPCTVYPVVIPSRQVAHVTFTWVAPDSITPVRIAMWTSFSNYLEARVDPVAGLTCSTSGMVAPREPVGYC